MVPVYKLTFLFLLASSIAGVLMDPRDFSVLGFFFMLVWLVGWFLVVNRLKSVYLNGEVLSVSNYLKTIEIPVSEITAVEASRLWGWQPQTVTLKLRSTSIFGDEIAFVPKGKWFKAQSFADELRRTWQLP